MKQLLAHRQHSQRRGFTLLEILLVIAVTAIFMSIMLELFLKISQMSDLSDSKTIAYIEIQNVLEQMRDYTFDDLSTDYASGGSVGNTFTPAFLTGKGVIVLSDVTSYSMTATLTICWRETNGRVIGEDQDLDGVLDAGEDTNGDGSISSPVQVEAIIANYD